MATTVINVPQQAVGQQPIVLQQPGGQQPIVLPPGVFQQQVNNAQTTQGTSGSISRYNAEAGKVTGILQLIAAAVTIICTSIALAVGTDYRSGWGIWAGIGLYGLGGVLGIVSAGRNKGVIIAYLVFSILSSISAPSQMIYDSVASSQGGRKFFYYFCSTFSSNSYYTSNCPKKDPILEVVHAISAVAMFCEMIIAIVASCYCCCGGLCGNGGGQSHTQTVVVTQYPQQGAGTVLTTQHQQVPYQQPPYQQPPHQQQFQQPAPYQQPAQYQQQPAPFQQPPYQQPAYTAPGPSQQSPYTPLNFNQPGGANPSAPADPPPAYEASIRPNTSPAENPDNEYMEVTQ